MRPLTPPLLTFLHQAIIGDSMFASVSSNMADLLRQYSNGADITNRASFGASFRRQTTE